MSPCSGTVEREAVAEAPFPSGVCGIDEWGDPDSEGDFYCKENEGCDVDVEQHSADGGMEIECGEENLECAQEYHGDDEVVDNIMPLACVEIVVKHRREMMLQLVCRHAYILFFAENHA